MNDQDHATQLALARKLLQTVRHAAYATVNEDGTPHNSPLMLIYNAALTKLYIGSYSDSLHVKNLLRTGNTFVTLFDSFTKGQGGVYITGTNAHECEASELPDALQIHNTFRAKYNSRALTLADYQKDKPAQRMYSIDIATIEVYSVRRGDDGLILNESRVKVDPASLLADEK
jgi:hypothetical protein